MMTIDEMLIFRIWIRMPLQNIMNNKKKEFSIIRALNNRLHHKNMYLRLDWRPFQSR